MSINKARRTTVVMPVELDENWEVYALMVSKPKMVVIQEVLFEFLKSKGLQPDKRPRKIEVSYEDTGTG